MTILNQAELLASLSTNLPDNATGEISPADLRGEFGNLIDSLQSYGGVIDDGTVDDVPITGTPTKWPHFTNDVTSPNDILEADVANDRILAKAPALYFVTLRFFGKWSAGEDLTFSLYVNGAPNAVTPVSFSQEGQGANDPIIVSVTDIAFIINSAAIAAGPGGNSAAIELYLSSTTGTFNLDQINITMGAEYNPLSIRTVG